MSRDVFKHSHTHTCSQASSQNRQGSILLVLLFPPYVYYNTHTRANTHTEINVDKATELQNNIGSNPSQPTHATPSSKTPMLSQTKDEEDQTDSGITSVHQLEALMRVHVIMAELHSGGSEEHWKLCIIVATLIAAPLAIASTRLCAAPVFRFTAAGN